MLLKQKKRQSLLSLAIETANKFSEIDKSLNLSQIATVGSNSSQIGERLQQVPKNKRGRKPKSP